MAASPKKSGAEDGAKKMSGGGIERFFVTKKRPTSSAQGGGKTSSNTSAKKLSPKKSSVINSKKKSCSAKNDFSIRKRPPSDDGATESSVKRGLSFSPHTKKKKTTQRQKSMEAMGFTIQKDKSPSKISYSMPEKVKERVEEGIEQVLFERDAITVPTNQVPSPPAETLIQPVVNAVPLNSEQQRVVECSPNIPLYVRACAGTGKTHTMVKTYCTHQQLW